MTFKEFKKAVLFKRVVEWNQDKNEIVLEDGTKITIECTEQDCCAWAGGTFKNVKLDAAITDVTKPKYKHWDDGDTYGCKAKIKMLHNRNLVCLAEANADAGNSGYYYSIASFIVTLPNKKQKTCFFVGSEGDEKNYL